MTRPKTPSPFTVRAVRMSGFAVHADGVVDGEVQPLACEAADTFGAAAEIAVPLQPCTAFPKRCCCHRWNGQRSAAPASSARYPPTASGLAAFSASPTVGLTSPSMPALGRTEAPGPKRPPSRPALTQQGHELRLEDQ